ncbi:M1 family metallopeptidase [Chitinophaga tropicalis]|nr:M1 family metallopeptidase [Chitinophaga tropicalis]
MKPAIGFFLFVVVHLSAVAQFKESVSKYNPQDIFPALPALPAGNSYRAAHGEPGPAYWQNRCNYSIDAVLDDERNVVYGTEVITYTNNSPHTLSYLWLQLDQNVFKQHSRGLDAKLFLDSNHVKQKKDFEGGYVITDVRLISKKDTLNTGYRVDDTRMQLQLAQPLVPGASVGIRIKYSYTIPRFFYNADFNVNRTDIMPTAEGNIYSIAQWYPRLCVFDDVEGWNTLPYLGNGEFYLEYGDFNVNITLPSAYIVSASGELLNPEEVLTPLQQQRWNQAHNSDTKVFIRTPEEVKNASSRPSKPACTWKFRMSNTRDFAWTASKSFVWEGIRINLPDGKKAFGISLYPVASKLSGSWDRSSEYIKFTIEYFSKKWYQYPYPCAVNVASNLDGMEYPGIVFCSARDTGNDYWRVVNHELGHTWFPMIVGSNERKYAWMDEGFNMFIDYLACEDFNSGEFKGYAPLAPPAADYFADSAVSVLTRPDGIRGDMVLPSQYLKIAYLLGLLRNHILGAERFDYAFRHYISQWAFKHPTPWDFFRCMNNAAGEDLTWFWKETFIENYKLDQAIAGVNEAAEISIENLEKAAMPLIIEITTVSGKKVRRTLPVEIWQYDHRYVLKTGITERISSVVIDPDNVYPDQNRANNSWKPAGQM